MDVPVCTLPPLELTYLSAAGLVYVFRAPWGAQEHATATDLHNGTTWARLQVNVPKSAREAAAFAVQQFARQVPPSPISPRVTECLPPTAPDRLRPTTDDAERGRTAWAGLAPRLAPAGRLTVGAALMAPWVEPSSALTSIWSLTGQRGYGKSLLGAVCAALYGTTDPGQGLFGGLDAAAQGLSAWLKQLAYLPPVLDEAQSATADLGAQMRAIVMGAQRRRATRSGAAAPDFGRWGGLAIVTGNEPLTDVLTHEMFGRRLIELDARDLWRNPHAESAIQEREGWWEQVGGVLPAMEGWPWHALQEQFTPGPDARKLVARVRRHPLPAADNPGKILRLAYVGCEWLAEWTGNSIWLEDTWNAAVRLGAETAERGLDPARDAARAIIGHRVRGQGWTDGDRERVGYPDNHEGACAVEHDGPCEWWAMPSATFQTVIDGLSPKRLSGTTFPLTLFAPEVGRLTHRAMIPGTGVRVRSYVVCLTACSILAEPDDHTITDDGGLCVGCGQPSPIQVDGRPLHPTCEPPSPPSPAPAPAPAPAPELVPAQTPDAHYSWTDSADPGEALATAVADGVTDLTGPDSWTPQQVEIAGWDTHGWQGLGAAGAQVTRDGHTIRIRRDRNPQRNSEALEDWARLTGRPVESSVASLAVRLLREHGEASSGRSPRWNLPDEIADLWPGGEVAQVRQWGTDNPDHSSWDRNLSYLPAITQARVAPLWHGEKFERYTGSQIPTPSGQHSGMWRIVVPEWNRPDLPSPAGTIDPGREIWTTTERMRLYHSLGITPVTLEAVLAPAHKIDALERWAEQVKGWIGDAADRPALTIGKGLYQTLAGRIAAEWARGRRFDVYRPDWGWAIIDNSWCSVLRRVYKIDAEHGITPSRVLVDAIAYPGSEPPPGLPIGDGLGQFHPEPKKQAA